MGADCAALHRQHEIWNLGSNLRTCIDSDYRLKAAFTVAKSTIDEFQAHVVEQATGFFQSNEKAFRLCIEDPVLKDFATKITTKIIDGSQKEALLEATRSKACGALRTAWLRYDDTDPLRERLAAVPGCVVRGIMQPVTRHYKEVPILAEACRLIGTLLCVVALWRPLGSDDTRAGLMKKAVAFHAKKGYVMYNEFQLFFESQLNMSENAEKSNEHAEKIAARRRQALP